MLIIRFKPLLTYLGSLYVILASIVILIPSYEISIWWGISAVVFLPSIVVASIYGTAIERLLAILSFIFVAMLPFGFPGTLVGWSGSLLIGLQCGRTWFTQLLNGRMNILLWTFAIAPLFCMKIFIDLATEGISHELLSNFFQSASINYANSVLLGSASLIATCMILQDIINADKQGTIKNVKRVRNIALLLMPISLGFVLAMDYRSGAIGVIGLLIFYLSRFSKIMGYYLCGLLLILVIFFYEFIVYFLVPGRDGVSEIFTELVDDDNRFYRAINFASKVLIDKSNFAGWVDYFSVSALSDFIAVAFPLSVFIVLYFFIYLKNIVKTGLFSMRWEKRASLMLILGSGLAISLLQPDFYNMFVVGFQISLINLHVRFRSINKT